MTDKEKACKACCNSIPCKKMCNFGRCYMAGLAEGRKESEDKIVANRKLNEIKNYLAYDIPHELMNEATNKIWKML